MNIREVIKRPVITEKSMLEMDDKKYTFIVDKRANKIHIKKAVEEIFDVEVEKVNVIRTKGKPKRFNFYQGYTQSLKKAVVKLKEDSNDIELFPEIEEETVEE